MRRRGPLVSPEAVRRWASTIGLELEDGRLDRDVIDLYLEHRHRDGDTGRAAQAPTARCPRCGRLGYLDHIDMVQTTQTQRCAPCGVTWTSIMGASEGAPPRRQPR